MLSLNYYSYYSPFAIWSSLTVSILEFLINQPETIIDIECDNIDIAQYVSNNVFGVNGKIMKTATASYKKNEKKQNNFFPDLSSIQNDPNFIIHQVSY